MSHDVLVESQDIDEDCKLPIPGLKDILAALDEQLGGEVSPEVAAGIAKTTGIAAFQRGDFEEAINTFTRAAKLEPADALIGQLLELSKLCQWDSQGMPVLQLASYEVACRLADDIQRASSDAKRKANAAFKAGNFDNAVKYFAEALSFSPSDNISARLFELSNMHVWEKSGIPVFRCRNFKTAKQLVEKCKKIEDMTMQDLKDWYGEVGFPEEQEITRSELAGLYRKFIIWQSLPLGELQMECSRKSVAVRRASIGDEAKQSQQLAKTLLIEERMEMWEARGIETKRLGDVYAVSQLVIEFEQINQMTLETLRKVYHEEMTFPEETDMTRDEFVRVMRKYHFWNKLPLPELLRECERLKVPDMPNHQNLSQEELNTLPWKLLIQDRMSAWESKGIPVKRFPNVDSVVALLNEYTHMEKLSLEEFQEWYTGLGFPLEASMSKDEFIGLYRKIAVWRNLPIDELRKECLSKVPSFDVGLAKPDEHAQREYYLLKLLCHDRFEVWTATGIQVKRLKDIDTAVHMIRIYEEIDKLSLEELQAWYSALGLPDSEDMDAEALRQFRKTVEFWRCLPLSELRAECSKFKVAFMPMKKECGSDEDQFTRHLEQLLESNRMNAWEASGFPAKSFGNFRIASGVMKICNNLKAMSDDQLKQVSADSGLRLPHEEFDRRRVLETLKKFSIWESLPTRSLEKECHERGIHVPIGRVRKFHESKDMDAERRSTLIQSLKMDLQMNDVIARSSEPLQLTDTRYVEASEQYSDCKALVPFEESIATMPPDEKPGTTLLNSEGGSRDGLNEGSVDEEDQKSTTDWYDQPDLYEEPHSDSSLPDLLVECSTEQRLDDWYSSGAIDVD